MWTRELSLLVSLTLTLYPATSTVDAPAAGAAPTARSACRYRRAAMAPSLPSSSRAVGVDSTPTRAPAVPPAPPPSNASTAAAWTRRRASACVRRDGPAPRLAGQALYLWSTWGLPSRVCARMHLRGSRRGEQLTPRTDAGCRS